MKSWKRRSGKKKENQTLYGVTCKEGTTVKYNLLTQNNKLLKHSEQSPKDV